MSDLGRRIGAFRTQYLPEVGPFGGGVPTLSAYGGPADRIWTAYEGLDPELTRAMDRIDYVPVSAYEASWSSAAETFVAARYWLSPHGLGVKDLTTFSSAAPEDMIYLSGYPGPEVVGNPRWRSITNVNPRLRGDYGFYEAKEGRWWMRDHHFDPFAPSSTAAPGLAREFLRALARTRR